MSHIFVEDLKKSFFVSERTSGMLGSIRGFVQRKTKEVYALKGVSFSLEQGELVGYIGPNGAGKSTTIKILSGILVPTSGKCIIGGRTPWKDRIKHVGRIGVVFGQRTQLWWDLPVIESFDLLRDIYRVPDSEYRKTRTEMIDLLALESFLYTPVRQLSLGQRMRCDFAAAMLHRPDILFLDEPTIGLDASLEVMNILTYGGVETAQYPLSIYSKWFQRFFTFVIPLGCVSYFPLVAVLGKDISVPLWFCYLSPIAGILFLFIALKLWKIGEKHYCSTGS